jgi:hypothetical protein
VQEDRGGAEEGQGRGQEAGQAAVPVPAEEFRRLLVRGYSIAAEAHRLLALEGSSAGR